MKKVITIILCAVLLIFGFETLAFAANTEEKAMIRLNNAVSTESSFSVNNGKANIAASYTGYPGVTTGAKITVQLQKRNLLVFWKDVTSWENVSYEDSGIFTYSYPVSSGTYRVKIKYEISGSGGATDVIEEELKDSY